MANQTETNISYPIADIDPRDKGYDWVLSYFKAAWNDAKSYLGNTLYYGANRYSEIRRYGMGKQTVNKYKKIYGIDEQNNETFMTVDWSPIAIAAKYREIAISIIVQKMYDFEIFAVDPLSKSEEDAHFQQLQLRMMMRKAVQEMNLPIKNFPQFQKTASEPEDDEELEIRKGYGFKHNLAMDAELGCTFVHQMNNQDEERLKTAANLFDFGWGGYKDWIDETGMTRYRAVNPENFVCSYCVKNDFSDAQHMGEVIEVLIVDLAPYFDTEQLKDIAKNHCGIYNNPKDISYNRSASNYFGNFKVRVWDACFLSVNSTVYKNEVDNLGNLSVSKTDFQNKRPSMKGYSIEYQGAQYPKYMEAKRKVVYKGKWVIGTEYMYDWGLMENQKRNADTWWETNLPFRMYAWNFDRMQFTGITERLIPIIDDWHRTYFKLQDMKNKLVPYIMNLNMSAIEAAGFAGKGGQKMSPMQQVDFLLQNWVAVFRETDLLKQSPTGKVAWFEATGQLEVMTRYREELFAIERQFMSVTGLNEVTNGSTPDPRTLTDNIQAQITSTNNCLYLVSRAEKVLYQRLTTDIIADIQLAVQMGKVDGYVRAIGKDSVQYFEISKDIALRKFGMFVRDAPTPMERQQFLADLKMKDAQGQIEPEDYIIIKECTNLKQAAEILAYKIKKRKEQAQQYQLQVIKEQAQQQAQGTMMIEQEKQKTIMLQGKIDMEKLMYEMQMQYQIELMKKQSDMQEGAQQGDAKVISGHLAANAKIISSQIAADAQKASAAARKSA